MRLSSGATARAALLATLAALLIVGTHAGTTDNIQDLRESLPRKDYSFADVSDEFCGPLPASGTLDNRCSPDYQQSIVVIILLGGVIGAVAFAGGMIFMIVRCCDGCGGNMPSTGRCCSRIDDHPGYTKTTKLFHLIAALAIAVALLAAMSFALGADANDLMHDSIENTRRSYERTAESIQATTAFMKNNVTRIISDDPTFSVNSSIATTVNSVNDVAATTLMYVRDVGSLVDLFETLRKDFVYIGFTVATGLALFGLLGYFTSYAAMLAASLSILTTAALFLSLGIHLGTSTTASDMCVYVKEVQNQTQWTEGHLDALLNCNNGSLYSTLLDMTNKTASDAEERACTYMNSFCGSANVTCPGFSVAACNRSSLLGYINAATVDDEGVSRSVRNCSTECTGNALETGSLFAVGNDTTARGWDNFAFNLVQPLYRCDVTLQFFKDAYEPLCEDFVQSSDKVIVASLCAGLVDILAIIVLFRGEKRFRKEFSMEHFSADEINPEIEL